MDNLSLGLIGAVIGGAGILYFETRESLPQKAEANGQPGETTADTQPPAPQVSPAPQPRQRRTRPPQQQQTEPPKRSIPRHVVPQTPPATQPAPATVAQPPTTSSSAEPETPTPSTEVAPRADNVNLEVLRVLVGGQLADTGLLDEHVLDDHGSHGRYVVYFSLDVTGQDDSSGRISYADFRLEDSKGLLYEPIGPKDALDTVLRPGETARGGIAFAVYNDAAPARLLVRTAGERFQPLPETIFSRDR